MAVSASATVYHTWESILDRKIDRLKGAVYTNDPWPIAYIQNQDLGGVNYAAAFWLRAKEYDGETLEAATKRFQELENYAIQATQATKEEYDKVQAQMDDFKNTDKGKESAGWEEFLDNTIDAVKAQSDQRWENLRIDGKNTISKMPESLREPAAHSYGGALGAIADFMRKSIDWLVGAFNTVAEWFKVAWEKIKEWANDVKDWFVAAYNSVKGWFGNTKLDPLSHNGGRQ